MSVYKEKVLQAVENAHSICWDGCHKIYIMEDEIGTNKMREQGYEIIVTKDEMNPKKMATQIRKWYTDSCPLRFVQMISGTGEDNLDYTDIVSQCETWK